MRSPSRLRSPQAASAVRSCSSTDSTRPSLMWTMRSPKPKTRLSCVTTMTARPGCTATWRISSMTVWPDWASRAAVGSSQTSSRGSWTRPGRWPRAAAGRRTAATAATSTLVAQADRVEHLARPARPPRAAAGRRSAAARRRSRRRSAPAAGCTAGRRSRCSCRGTRPAAGRRAASGPCPAPSTSPAVGSSRPAMIEISVVLPQPDGPTSSVISPAGTSRSTPRRASTSASRRRRTPWSRRGRRRPQSVVGSVMVSIVVRLGMCSAASVITHPRNTTAGSSTSTLRMLTRLDSITIDQHGRRPCRPAPARACRTPAAPS